MTFCRLSLDLNLYLEVKNSVIFQARSPDLNLDLKGQNFKMTLDFCMEVYLNILNIDLTSLLDLSPDLKIFKINLKFCIKVYLNILYLYLTSAMTSKIVLREQKFKITITQSFLKIEPKILASILTSASD